MRLLTYILPVVCKSLFPVRLDRLMSRLNHVFKVYVHVERIDVFGTCECIRSIKKRPVKAVNGKKSKC